MLQRHAHAERGHDLYETPSVAVEALLRVLALPRGTIWEPACGRGAIANVLRAHGHRVICTDLVDYGADSTAIYGVDFLRTTELLADVGSILTNPPFKIINKFIDHALRLCPQVIILCAPGGVGIGTTVVGPGRTWAKTSAHLPHALPMMHRDGWKGRKANSGMAFAWFVWERGYSGNPIAQRISWEDERDAGPVLLPHGHPTKVRGQVRRSNAAPTELMCLRACVETDGPTLLRKSKSGALSVRGALAALTDKQASG